MNIEILDFTLKTADILKGYLVVEAIINSYQNICNIIIITATFYKLDKIF